MDFIFPFDVGGLQLSLNGFDNEPLFFNDIDGMHSPQPSFPNEPMPTESNAFPPE
jgi:hypothetical protein